MWSLSLFHSYRVFVRGCFALLVLGPWLSGMPEAPQTLSGATRRSPGSEGSGQSHQTRLQWRALCSCRGVDTGTEWLCSPRTAPREWFCDALAAFCSACALQRRPRGAQGERAMPQPRRKRGGTPSAIPRAPSTSRGVLAGAWFQPLTARDFPSLSRCLIAGCLHAGAPVVFCNGARESQATHVECLLTHRGKAPGFQNTGRLPVSRPLCLGWSRSVGQLRSPSCCRGPAWPMLHGGIAPGYHTAMDQGAWPANGELVERIAREGGDGIGPIPAARCRPEHRGQLAGVLGACPPGREPLGSGAKRRAGGGTRGPGKQPGLLWFRARKQMDLWLQSIDSSLKCYLASGAELPPPVLLPGHPRQQIAHHERQFKAGCGCGFFFFSGFFFGGGGVVIFLLLFPLQAEISSKESKPWWLGSWQQPRWGRDAPGCREGSRGSRLSPLLPVPGHQPWGTRGQGALLPQDRGVGGELVCGCSRARRNKAGFC